MCKCKCLLAMALTYNLFQYSNLPFTENMLDFKKMLFGLQEAFFSGRIWKLDTLRTFCCSSFMGRLFRGLAMFIGSFRVNLTFLAVLSQNGYGIKAI